MTTIAFDYTPAYEQTAGIGRYVRELVTGLSRHPSPDIDFRLFVSGIKRPALPPSPSHQFTWRSTPIAPQWLARIWHRLRMPVPIELFVGSVDLYHATDFVLPPHFPSTRTILTVHDLSFIMVPDTTPASLKAYLDKVVPRSAKRATHILADSTATMSDLVNLYGINEQKISVLLGGVDRRFRRNVSNEAYIRRTYDIGDRPYILSVGTVQPRKNYERLVRALELLHEAGYHDFDLVISGGRGWLDNPLFRAINRSPIRNHIHLIGFTDDKDLPGLYSNAVCLAFPSLYEGFGFPILEAMACGTPVMTSNTSSLPEVAGGAALLVDPTDVDGMVDTLIKLISDSTLRERLIDRGYAQASSLSWDRTALNLLEIYRKTLNQ